MSDFFPANEPYPIRSGVQAWFERAVAASLTFTSDIRIVIETPDVLVGIGRDGRRRTSEDLCILRLQTLRRVVKNNPQVRDHMVACEWRITRDEAGGAAANWEERGVVRVAFSNTRAENR